ncbi:hypothetical protein DCCM_3808 [Desulfocucumis palustris]|uniref:Uncharacterized protein n=1 Tax=Desulfocucumis palustris TaxID=1898651 RepID=A0A2L2XEM9_9FIRM|nr:hypothetical protein DCCM_3808 [Desulfocucumis palustris]
MEQFIFNILSSNLIYCIKLLALIIISHQTAGGKRISFLGFTPVSPLPEISSSHP